MNLYATTITTLFVLSQIINIVSALEQKSKSIIDGNTERAEYFFIENRGQIGDQGGKPNPTVKYLILRPGLNIQLKANSFSYDAYTIERFKKVERLEGALSYKIDNQIDDSLVYHFSRVDIELVDANPNPQITHEGASSDYLNYYTYITSQTKGEDGVFGVRGYSTITYHEIYPNIDLEWFLDKDGRPEYQFIINPGGDPSKIRLRYHGAKKTELVSKSIIIHLITGVIEERIPNSYLASTKEKVEVEFYKICDSEYGFSVPLFSSNETLIIDPVPNRLWGTYIGGNQPVYCNKVLANNTSEVYVIGGSTSSSGLATSGSHQSTIGGDWDAYIMKFSGSGTRIWGTYYGGNQAEDGTSLALDASQNVYCVGKSSSANSISTTGAHQPTLGGGTDGFILKLDPQGTRQWCTYYGGSGGENIFDISDDGSDNFFIVGMTNSANNISTPGSHQGALAGDWDLFLLRISSAGTRSWCTYYGGSSEESIPRVSAKNNNIIIVGKTLSNNNISTGGSHQPNRNGYYDGLIAKFDPNGNRVWASYYGGTEFDDIVGVSQNTNGALFISGSTKSPTSIATSGVFQTNYSGGITYGDAFVASFSQTGVRIWGTYYGGSDDDLGKSLHCDASGNSFLIGQTSSTAGIASSGSYQSTYGNNKDVFFAKVNSSGMREFGTYYGGSDDDDGSHIYVQNGMVYVCGITWSAGIYGTTGTHQSDISGSYIYNGFVTKFEDNATPIPNSISTSIGVIQFCEQGRPTVSYTAIGTYNTPNTFTVQLSNATGSFSAPTVIGTINSTSSGMIQCQIPANIPPGTGYRIRVVSSNPVILGSDNGINISINPTPQPIITGAQSVCISQTPNIYSVQQLLGHTYQWHPIQKGVVIGSSTSNSINIRWTMSGLDTLKIRQVNTQTGCSKDTFIVVNINDAPFPVISGPVSVCTGSSVVAYAVPNVNGHTYQWYSLGKGIINGSSTGHTLTVQWNQAGIDSLRVRQTNSSTGCFKDTLLYVTVQALPMPMIAGPKQVCEGSTNQIYSVPLVNGHTYQWSLIKNGNLQGTRSENSIRIDWRTTGTDTLRIRQTNPMTGCFKDTAFIVTIYPNPRSSITGAGTVCLSSTLESYSIPKRSGETYFWYPPSLGAYMSGQTEERVEVLWTSTGTDTIRVSITNTNTGCSQDTFFVVSIVKAIKPKIASFGNQNILCKGDSRGLECLTDAQSYQWKRNGKIIDGAKDKIYLAFEAGEYTVHIKSGICEGESEILKLIEYDNPKPSILGDKEVVAGSKEMEYRVSSQGVKSTLWTVSSNAIIKGNPLSDKINIQFPEPGKVKVSAKQESEFGCTGEDSIFILVTSMTDVKEVRSSSFEFFISPNPTGEADQFLVRFAEIPNQDISIELLDILGSIQYSNTLQAGSGTCTIPVQGLSSGMYMLRVRMNNEVFIEKVIVN